MIYEKTSPIGIDASIQRLQKRLYDALTWSPMKMFGRVYKNNNDGNILPQPYLANGEYSLDSFLNDDQNAYIFYTVADENRPNGGPSFDIEIKVVFMLNLKSLYPSVTHRADSEAQRDAFIELEKIGILEEMTIQTGLKKSLEGYDTKHIEKLDIQPFHTFAIAGRINYYLNKCD